MTDKTEQTAGAPGGLARHRNGRLSAPGRPPSGSRRPYPVELIVECPHGLDDPAWCSICKNGPSEPDEVIALGQPFAAKFGGDCPACDSGDGVIRQGDQIQKWSDQIYRHVGCRP